MNLRYVLKQLGLLHLVLSGFLLAVATVFIVAEAAGDQAMDRSAWLALFITGAAGCADAYQDPIRRLSSRR